MGAQTFTSYGLQILMQTFMNYGLQILMGLEAYELWAPNINGPAKSYESRAANIDGLRIMGSKLLMGVQMFMNYGLEILMGL